VSSTIALIGGTGAMGRGLGHRWARDEWKLGTGSRNARHAAVEARRLLGGGFRGIGDESASTADLLRPRCMDPLP
jgi:predicted dinucleotide-binding enzyme